MYQHSKAPDITEQPRCQGNGFEVNKESLLRTEKWTPSQEDGRRRPQLWRMNSLARGD